MKHILQIVSKQKETVSEKEMDKVFRKNEPSVMFVFLDPRSSIYTQQDGTFPSKYSRMLSSDAQPNLPLASVVMFIFVQCDGVRKLRRIWLAVQTQDQAWLARLKLLDVQFCGTDWGILQTVADVSQLALSFSLLTHQNQSQVWGTVFIQNISNTVCYLVLNIYQHYTCIHLQTWGFIHTYT